MTLRADLTEMGSIISCEMLHRTNLIAVVGGGHRPKFADNTILIFDDLLKRFVLEFTFTQPVVAVRLKRDRSAIYRGGVSTWFWCGMLALSGWSQCCAGRSTSSRSRASLASCSRWRRATTRAACARSTRWWPPNVSSSSASATRSAVSN